MTSSVDGWPRNIMNFFQRVSLLRFLKWKVTPSSVGVLRAAAASGLFTQEKMRNGEKQMKRIKIYALLGSQ